LVEEGDGAEAIPGIPAGIGQSDFGLGVAQGILKIDGAGDEVADFELLDEGLRVQQALPGGEGHFFYYYAIPFGARW
jgi:hypothetical protein